METKCLSRTSIITKVLLHSDVALKPLLHELFSSLCFRSAPKFRGTLYLGADRSNELFAADRVSSLNQPSNAAHSWLSDYVLLPHSPDLNPLDHSIHDTLDRELPQNEHKKLSVLV